MRILVLETSTNSAKAAVFSQDLELICSFSKPFPGGLSVISQRSVDDVWKTLAEVCKNAAKDHSIDIVSINGIWMSLLLCDSDLQPLSPVYTWADIEAREITSLLRNSPDYVHHYRSITGCNVHAMFSYFKLMNKKNENGNLRGVRIFSEASYLFAKMTGNCFSSKCLESASGLMNISTLDWEKELLDILGISREQLPDLMPYDTVYPLKAQAAKQLGLTEGIQVCLPHSDGAMNQLGDGALTKGIMTLSVGTSGAMRIAVDSPAMNLDLGTWLFYSPDTWLLGASTAGAANCVNWFRSNIMQSSDSWSSLNELADKAHYDTPVFLPFLYGERCPGWQDSRTGGFTGIKSGHGLPELYAGLLEGIVFNLYQCYEEITTTCGEPEAIRLSGGILSSNQWMQILSGVWQKDIILSPTDQVSMLGGAVLALKACGLLSSLEEYKPDAGKTMKASKKESEIYRYKYDRYLEYYSKV